MTYYIYLSPKWSAVTNYVWIVSETDGGAIVATVVVGESVLAFTRTEFRFRRPVSVTGSREWSERNPGVYFSSINLIRSKC